MSVSEIIQRRRSVRAFRADPVAATTVREILELAALAPSSSNMQPWRVWAIAGDDLAALKQLVRASAAANPRGEPPQYPIYAPDLKDPYNARRIACAEALYGLLGVARDNKLGRLMQFARNFDFYGAPVGLIVAIDRTMERGQWADIGIYLAHLLLLAEERGLATCAQAAWAGMNQTVRTFLNMPDEYILYCGVSMGYADEDAPINRLRIGREPLAVTTEMRGFGAEVAA
ncbi:nitroreductase [Bradyrhizobium sp. HKCCYLS20291]|uniref:nitroreductase n=1 Tax=Bradyrhizobium sp. HKCCYLS20291 TaxID=3420766 RepID=UPI003EB76268